MKRILTHLLITAVLTALFQTGTAYADIQEVLVPEPRILLILGSCLMVFAFYNLLRNK